MSTFGCHNCGVDLKSLEGKPYEEWPCATCALSKNYAHTFNSGYFDTAKMDEAIDDGEYINPGDHKFITKGKIPMTKEELATLESIQTAVEHQMYAMFSGLLIKLLIMAKDNPVMFEVIIKKMQFPYMSYSEIGASMNPKCSKQNILYHLKNAISMFPELSSVIQTDSRYTAGHYALKTLADKKRKEIVDKCIQENLYGKHYHVGRFKNIQELNAMLKLPFMIGDEVLSFNAYIKDENHINDEHENKAQ